MDISTCYQLLGLTSDASYQDVKASYRRLVRRYHPDANPQNVEWAKEKFIELTQAYQTVMATLATSQEKPKSSQTAPTASAKAATVKVRPKSVTISSNPNLSDVDNRFKQQAYHQLQEFLKNQRFPRAIALVDGLVHRIPNDPEIRQWQAIAYQRWAHHLIDQRDYGKARIYLKKALKLDPKNRALWTAVRRDFDRIERLQMRQSF